MNCLSSLFKILIFLLLTLTVMGCSSGGGGNDGGSGTDETSSATQQNYKATTDDAGSALFSFPINAGQTSFQLIAQSGVGVLELTSLRSPQGEELLNLTSQALEQNQSNEKSPGCVTYPYFNGVVSPGNYSASFTINNAGKNSVSNQATTLTVVSKADSNMSAGTLPVNIVLLGPVADATDLRGALEDSVAIFEGLFKKANITLDLQWYNFAGPTIAPDPREGDDLYAQISTATRPDAINLVFASRLQGIQSPNNRFGLAGQTPGVAVPLNRNAIVLSIIELTGGDGTFEDTQQSDPNDIHDNEMRLAGEEAARLTARYLGLEDIVQFTGSTVTGTDSLSDTSSCLTLDSCRDSEDTRSNVMFPRILKVLNSRDVSYYPRDEFSEQQNRVLNNSVLVR